VNRAPAWVVILTAGMGVALGTASGAPQVQKNAPVGKATTTKAVASQGTQAQYLDYLKKSLTQQTQWAVFQPNNPKLWANVRQNTNSFLLNEWKQGKLKGARSQEAFYVKCDSTTMTQADINSGRLICLVGVAPTRPAEFVTIRINQWTAGHK
jgi:phage tail sheath protein FI